MDRDQAVADYLSGLGTLRELAAADSQRLARTPTGGGWSAAWVIHHLADVDVLASERLRRVLSEDSPRFMAFDPDAFAEPLHYDGRSVGGSVAVIAALREANVSLLSTLNDAQWRRTGIHPVHGEVSVEHWMRTHTQHLSDHISQALEAVSGE